MRYNQYKKLRKRQKEAFVVSNTIEEQKRLTIDDLDSTGVEDGMLAEESMEMRDPVAKYFSSPSPNAYGSRLFPDEQVHGRWDVEDRPKRQDPTADLILKHFPNGTPRAKSTVSSPLAAPKKFDFEEALKRLDDRKQLMAKHLTPRSKSIHTPISLPSATEEQSKEIRAKISGPVRNKSYSTRNQTTIKKFKYHYVDDLVDDFSSSNVKSTAPKQRGDFLPVAMPYLRIDPPSGDEGGDDDDDDDDEDDDDVVESRTVFVAPGQIDVLHAPSYETRTDISDVTGLDIPASRQAYPQYHTSLTHFSPRPGQQRRPERPMRQGDFTKSRPHRIEIDLTDIETVEDALKSVRDAESMSRLRADDRYGLPYETTDFRADDECSEDSWDRAIAPQEKEHRSRSLPVQRDAIDVEKLFSEHRLASQNPSPHRPPVDDTMRSDNVDISDLIKETLSAEGDVVVDVSEVRENDVQNLRSPKKPSKGNRRPQKKISSEAYFSKTREELLPVAEHQPALDEVRVAESTAPRPAQVMQLKEKAPEASKRAIDVASNPQNNSPSPVQVPTPNTQVHNRDTPCLSLTTANEPNPLFSSIEASSKYLKMLADGIGSQGKMLADGIGSQGKMFADEIGSHGKMIADGIGSQGKMIADGIGSRGKAFADGIGSQLMKLDQHLLPEDEMNNMLGVLDRDLKATPGIIPEGKAVGGFFDGKITLPSFVENGMLSCSSPKNIDMPTFSVNSIDEMLDKVKQTYEKNAGRCGANAVVEDQLPPPQTFIVPISLRFRENVDQEADQPELLPVTMISDRPADETAVASSS